MKYFLLFEAFDFIKKHGIKPEKADPKHNSNSIGYSDKRKSWWGWSHRAFAEFKVGSKVKVGDCAFEPSNKEEFLMVAKNWYDNDPMYKKVEYEESAKGVTIKYTIGGKRKEEGEEFRPYPTKWGKGEWTAKTAADAKQMAMNFAEDVS